jgi:hypothetical protein
MPFEVSSKITAVPFDSWEVFVTLIDGQGR